VRPVLESRESGGAEPISPRRKWRTITLATLLLVPAQWALLAGIVASATDAPEGAPDPTAAFALGFALVPFVMIVLAFGSGQRNAPLAVLKAMGMALLVAVLVSPLAGDAVTGIVAAVGAGGMLALRRDPPQTRKARVIGVVVAAAYTFALVHTVGAIALLPAPIFPLTALGLADVLMERRAEGAAVTT
jgi:hypothetical protein